MAHNHLQRVYVVRTSFWAGHSDWEDAPVAARSWDGRTLWTLWRLTSHFWSLIDVDIQIITKDQPLHQRNILGSIQQPSESPKAPSNILSLNSLHSTLLLLYSPQLYESNSTQPTLLPSINVWYLSQVKPSHRPLEAGTSVKTLCRQPHRSVGSTTGTNLRRKANKKKKKTA